MFMRLDGKCISHAPVAKSKRIWSGNTTITHYRPTHGTARKSNRALAVKRHQEDNWSKITRPLFTVKMIAAKLERIKKCITKQRPTQNTEVHKTIDQQNHRLRTDSSLKHRVCLISFYRRQIFALDCVVVKT